MDISKRNKYENQGFTLMELIVVVAGLAILSSLSIPNILGRIKLNRVEEAKALMNSYALDCLAKYRISTKSTTDFLKDAKPEDLSNERLSPLQYQIDGDKNKCANVAIKPLNDNEKDLFAFDFSLVPDSEGFVRIRKTGAPSDNKMFENSCKSWAGKNCGASADQKAKWAQEAAVAKAKDECDSAYSTWLSGGGTGQWLAWDTSNKSCTRKVFAFEGKAANSQDQVDEMEKAKYGRACLDWRESKKDSISPNGNPETKNPECGGKNYWFHSGNIFTTQAAWTAHDNLVKEQACIENRAKALQSGTKGEYTYNPAGPPPCGKVVWFCDGKEYETLEAYKSTTCGAPVPDPDPGPITPPHCKGFVPQKFWCFNYVKGVSPFNSKCDCR